MDALVSPDERCRCGRRSRVVLAPLGWRQVGDDALHRADDGDSDVTDTGESTKETVKPFARGRPGSCSVEPVVTTARMLFHFACEAAGAASTRLSPRPLSSGGRAPAKLGRNAPRERS